MNRVALAYENGDPAEDVKVELIEALKNLGGRAQRAAAAIENLGEVDRLIEEP